MVPSIVFAATMLAQAAVPADLAAQIACERLSADYAAAVDENDAAALAALFAADGVWTLRDVPQRGQAAIRAHMEGFARTKTYVSRHVTTNIRVTIIDRDHARGTALAQLYRYEPGALPTGGFAPTALGTFTDTYVKTPQGWRFASRKLDAVSAKR